MMGYPLRSANKISAANVIATMVSDRLRRRAELAEVIAGAQRTLAQSRALLIEVEAILAREELPLPGGARTSILKATVA